MAGIVHITVTMEMKTHLVKDQVQNGWTFASATQSAHEIGEAGVVLLNTFYNAPAHGVVVSSYFAHNVDRVIPMVAKVYQLSATSSTVVDPHGPGTGFGSPIDTIPMTAYSDPGSGIDLPEQVSVCLSYHGTTGGLSEGSGHSPRPASRHRGRVFLGPLHAGAIAIDPTTGSPVINGALLTSLGNNGGAGLMPSTAPSWVVWSRKNATVDPVVGGFIDNRFDTQRRRLETATFRQTF